MGKGKKDQVNAQPNEFYSTDKSGLQNWLYSPTLEELKKETQSYEQHTFQQMQKVSKWQTYIDAKPLTGLKPHKSNIVHKLIKKTNEWRYPSLEEPFLSNNNLFELDGTTIYEDDVEEMNQIINHQFTKEMDRVDFINKYIRNVGDQGTAILKVGWDVRFMTETKKIHVSEYDKSTHIINMDKSLLTKEDIANKIMVVDIQHKVKNSPEVEICKLGSIHFDPSCGGDLEKSRGILHEIDTTLSELVEDDRYSNLGSIKLSDINSEIANSSMYTENTLLSDVSITDIPRRPIKVNEYWGEYDIDGDGVVEQVVIAWVGETIIRMEENPYPLQEKPFVLVQYLGTKDNYGSTDAELLTDNQDLLSAIARGTIDTFSRTANGQTVTTKGAFDVVQQDKLDNGEHCKINEGYNVQDSVHTIKYPEIPQSIENFSYKYQKESEALTGVVGFGSGINGNAMGSTATAVRSAMDAVSKRELSILRRLASGLTKVARKVIRLNIEYLEDTDIQLITGKEEVFLKRTQFQSLAHVNINISTPELNASKAEQLSFMLQTLGNNIGSEITFLILAKINRLNGMEDLAYKIESYKPEPDPHLQEMQKLEIEEKKADILLKKAEAMERMANAREKGLKGDLSELEWLEKFTGLDHTKQKDLQDNQKTEPIVSEN